MAFPEPAAERRTLYPEIEPSRFGWMEVDAPHELYWEECGDPKGRPVVILHGGPGGGVNPTMRRFFKASKWRIVLFDQRGCGKSRPHAELSGNDTWALIADIERLRVKTGVDRWSVFGGSWGSTLALAYAETHPERVEALILRGIFLLTRKELLWFYQEGASMLAPDAWERYLAPIPPDERGDLIGAYHRRLTSPDRAVRMQAAAAWSRWEGDTISVKGPSARPGKFNEDEFAEAFARIECHYFVNGGFLPHENWILDNVERIRGVPGWIVQGRFDIVTPSAQAWALHQAWPEARFNLVPDAGHASTEPGIVDGLVRAGDEAYALLSAEGR